MTDKTLQILMDASNKVAEAKERQMEQDSVIAAKASDLSEKALANGAYYLRESFKKIIENYQKKPITFGDDQLAKESSYIYYTINDAEEPKPVRYIEDENESLAKFYNESRNIYDRIYFLRRGKSSKNKNLPIKINIERIRQYNIFSEFNRYFNECFYMEISVAKLHDLSFKAYNGVLESDDYLFSDEIIALLGKAYTAVEAKKEDMKSIIVEAFCNANTIYTEVYNKLADGYVEDPGCGLYFASFKAKTIDEENPRYQNVEYFKYSSMLEKDDDLRYLSHKNAEGVEEYIPVLLSSVKSLLKGDEKIGYMQLVDWGSTVDFKFDGEILGQFMDKLGSNNKKRVKANDNKGN